MTHSIEFSKTALKEMGKLPVFTQNAINEKLRVLAKDPKSAANVKALQGFDGLYRLRVGDYRVIYEIEHERIVILVLNVKHRKDAYR